MNKLIILFFILSFQATTSEAQFYIFGGYNYGAIQLKGTNEIITGFNELENHQLGAFDFNFHGYRFGGGKYGEFTLVELGFGNLISNNKSQVPNQLKENAEIAANFMSVSARAGIKPFKDQFFTVGLALHLGLERIRYSFGGDYVTPVQNYVIVPEIYVDYAIKLNFLTKKSQRDKILYLLRIRPYFQLHQSLLLGELESGMNQIPLISENAIEDKMDHFGFNISVVIPFMNDEERKRILQSSPKTKKKKTIKNK